MVFLKQISKYTSIIVSEFPHIMNTPVFIPFWNLLPIGRVNNIEYPLPGNIRNVGTQNLSTNIWNCGYNKKPHLTSSLEKHPLCLFKGWFQPIVGLDRITCAFSYSSYIPELRVSKLYTKRNKQLNMLNFVIAGRSGR